MSSGSNQVVTYEEVAAYQAEQGVATYAGNSGGYTTGGIWINWDQENGFSGTGWRFDDSSSPAYELKQSDIDEMINSNGNLDLMFSEWVLNIDYETRYFWILKNVPGGCRYEVIGG